MRSGLRVSPMLRISTWVPYLWLTLFFAVPFLIVLKVSLSQSAIAMPPYQPCSPAWKEPWKSWGQFSADNYIWLTGDTLYANAYLSSLRIAFLSTLVALLVGYPLAYAMARAPGRLRSFLLMMVILPFWTSFLIRVYAWIGILKQEGLLNQLLIWVGAIDEPLIILNTDLAVYIGIVYSYLPFMVLPLYASLERMDRSLLEAAADLGATPVRAFWRITVPAFPPGYCRRVPARLHTGGG